MNSDGSILALLRGWVECFNADDREGFRALLADDVRFTQVSSGIIDQAVDGVVASMWSWRRLFTEVHGEEVFSFSSADAQHGFMSLMWTCTRVPRNPADGERVVRFPAWYVGTQRDGRLVAVHDFYDRQTYGEQMGVQAE
jgi:hypothetical protein